MPYSHKIVVALPEGDDCLKRLKRSPFETVLV